MSESEKRLELSLEVSGGFIGLTREYNVDNKAITSGIVSHRKDQEKTTGGISFLEQEDVDDFINQVENVHAKMPEPEYKPEHRVYDGQTYVLKVHHPVEFGVTVKDGARVPEEFFTLTSTIQRKAMRNS